MRSFVHKNELMIKLKFISVLNLQQLQQGLEFWPGGRYEVLLHAHVVSDLHGYWPQGILRCRGSARGSRRPSLFQQIPM